MKKSNAIDIGLLSLLPPELCRVIVPFTPTANAESWEVEAFSLCVFTSTKISEWSPMERRAPAQGSSRDQCTRGPSSGTTRTQFYSSSTNTFITCSLYTVCRYRTSPGTPDLRARLG